jgi:hypothetical protein
LVGRMVVAVGNCPLALRPLRSREARPGEKRVERLRRRARNLWQICHIA